MTKPKTITMKADDPRLTNISSACVWNNCTASFKGDMPEGWTWQINYWDRKPTIMRWTLKQWATRPYQDVCLCAVHTRALNQLYKAVGNPFDNVSVGLEAKPDRDALDGILDAMKPAGCA